VHSLIQAIVHHSLDQLSASRYLKPSPTFNILWRPFIKTGISGMILPSASLRSSLQHISSLRPTHFSLAILAIRKNLLSIGIYAAHLWPLALGPTRPCINILIIYLSVFVLKLMFERRSTEGKLLREHIRLDSTVV
jgi:hypothetical protein